MSVHMESHHEPTTSSLPLEYQEDGNLKIFGFWVFLAAEVVLFSTLFATYLVFHGNVAGGPTSQQLFDIRGFTIETFLLLTSSFTMGLGTYEMRRQNTKGVVVWVLITVLLGLGFLGMEISEFSHYVSIGANISRSAFLSAFFVLVGTHGSHVTLGIFWILSILVQVMRKGITPKTARKLFVVGLYWHFLDVVWVFIFTVVYLTGKVM